MYVRSLGGEGSECVGDFAWSHPCGFFGARIGYLRTGFRAAVLGAGFKALDIAEPILLEVGRYNGSC